MPDFHSKLKQLAESLGYPKVTGFCYGFSLLWLSACLLKEEKNFAGRLKLINKLNTPAHITAIKEKVKIEQKINKQEKLYLELLSFFDCLLLYQSPVLYYSLFNTFYSQKDYEQISNFAGSSKLKDAGHLEKIYSFNNIYTHNQLAIYLNKLGKCIKEESLVPVAILLNGSTHTIALLYDPNAVYPWKLMNINYIKFIDQLSYNFMVSQFLPPLIAKSFNQTNLISLNIEVIVTGLHENKHGLATNLKKITSEINPELMLGHINDLLIMAAREGDLHDMRYLIRQGADINYRREIDGATPAFIAASYGNIHILVELVTYEQLDLNQSLFSGATPIFIAAQHGNIDIVQFLLKNNVNLNLSFQASAEDLKRFICLFDNIIIKRMNDFILNHVPDSANNFSLTPLDIAQILGHTQIVDLLKSQMKKTSSLGLFAVSRKEGNELQDLDITLLPDPH